MAQIWAARKRYLTYERGGALTQGCNWAPPLLSRLPVIEPTFEHSLLKVA